MTVFAIFHENKWNEVVSSLEEENRNLIETIIFPMIWELKNELIEDKNPFEENQIFKNGNEVKMLLRTLEEKDDVLKQH